MPTCSFQGRVHLGLELACGRSWALRLLEADPGLRRAGDRPGALDILAVCTSPRPWGTGPCGLCPQQGDHVAPMTCSILPPPRSPTLSHQTMSIPVPTVRLTGPRCSSLWLFCPRSIWLGRDGGSRWQRAALSASLWEPAGACRAQLLIPPLTVWHVRRHRAGVRGEAPHARASSSEPRRHSGPPNL